MYLFINWKRAALHPCCSMADPCVRQRCAGGEWQQRWKDFLQQQDRKPSRRRELWEQALKQAVWPDLKEARSAVIQKNTATMSPFDKGSRICSIMSKELNYNVYRHQKCFECVSEMARWGKRKYLVSGPWAQHLLVDFRYSLLHFQLWQQCTQGC